MKGVVFTEFFGMVAGLLGDDMVDDLVDATAPASGGAYTAVGTYDHREIVAMVAELSARTGTPVPDLLQAFGRHLFGRFADLYPVFFAGVTDCFEFLDSIETVIHVEVRKLYPDAELPRFESHRPDPGTMVLVYRSPRHLHDLAAGLIAACAEHFGQTITVDTEVADDGAIEFRMARIDVTSAAASG
ncbi:MAG: heme NO-binding domain-containing protein [Acidimicrobiales bacterium]